MKHIEIERKFLIKKPSEEYLKSKCSQMYNIEQIYLESDEKNITSRIRKTEENGDIRYYYTKKTDIDAYQRIEEEKIISKPNYEILSQLALTLPLEKKRYILKHSSWILEIDVYPFWRDKAILEIENLSEGEEFTLPSAITIIEEVTTDQNYSNYALAMKLSAENRIPN